MRFVFLLLLVILLPESGVSAQSVIDNLPPGLAKEDSAPEVPPEAPKVGLSADTYVVNDVAADVTADTTAHARDQALLEAEHNAYGQLCTRLGVADAAAKITDDALLALVQSFEVQSERLSPVRYIGVFTIRFKPSAVQKKIGIAPVDNSSKSAPSGPLTHVTVAVQADSLAAFSQIKRRITALPQVVRIDTLDLGRGLSHIDISYIGSIDDFKQAATSQGIVVRQSADGWQLYDGSMVPR